MALKKKDFQKLVNCIKEFQSRLPCSEASAELRDSLNLSLLLMHKYYKRARVRSHGNGVLEGSLSLITSLTGAASPMSPHISPVDKFDWRWLSLDIDKLSASFGHGDRTNFVPEIFYVIKDCNLNQLKKMINEDEDNINELDAIGRSTAMYATNGGTSDYLECLKFLISKGVDLQHQSNDGFTCLHIACFFGYKDFVSELLNEKVEVDPQDSEGRTPLHFAAAYCSQEIMQMLITNGANPRVPDNDGLTPAMWACHFDQLENLKLLLAEEEKSNPSPEARFAVVDSIGRTILHWAVTNINSFNCMKYLLNAETAHLCDDEGKTIFLFAAEHGCLAACEEILSLCGEDVLEDADNLGRTALHLASLGGHGEIVEFLLNKGAVAERLDSQGVSPLDVVTSRKLNYCNLVFTSYQRYRDRLASMQATLGGATNGKEAHEGQLLKSEHKAAVEVKVEEADEIGNGKNEEERNEVENEESRHSDGGDHGSLKMDCQGAIGFEIEGDIDREAELEGAEADREADDIDEKQKMKENISKKTEEEATAKKQSEEKNLKKEELEMKGDSPKHEINDVILDEEETVIKEEDETTENEMEEETKETFEKKVIEEDNVEIGDIPAEEHENEEVLKGAGSNEEVLKGDDSNEEVLKGDDSNEDDSRRDDSNDDDYDFEDVSIGVGGQKIVLVAHHEGEHGFDVDYGDGIEDIEFQDDEDDEDISNIEVISEDIQIDPQQLHDFKADLKVDDGVDRDLSPRVESITGLLESNTIAANQSVTMNISVSSLRSDSDEEDAVPSGKERISKLDSKIPMFEDRPINQLEYRDPFSKARPFLNLEDPDSHLKRNDDGRQKSGLRKEKKDNQKGKQFSPKGKQAPMLQSSPRMPLGPLEPMKPLQPIIPSQGIKGPRPLGGDSHGAPYDPMLKSPSSPRSPHERSNTFPNPSDSPRSKIPSPRSGFDGREGKISHIPRPSSPSSRERHFATASTNVFAPRPPIGR